MSRQKGMRGGLGVLAIFVLLNISLAAATATATETETVTETALEVKVGVVLDLNETVGKIGLSCISMALADFYSSSRSHYKTRVILDTIDSNGTVVDAAAAALELIKKEEVQAIIGPRSSMQASFMIDLGEKANVPIISFSATRPSLTTHRSPFFFRVAQADSSQVRAIGAIVKAFRWRQVVPIYVDNEFGDGIIPYLVGALQDVDANVPYQSIISPTATDDQINLELRKLMTMQTRVFVVHMLTRLSSRLFAMARKNGMMSRGYVWITTDAISNEFGSMEPSTLESMQGVLGIRTYVPGGIKRLQTFKRGWQRRFVRYYPSIEEIPELTVFGLWAYDAAWALSLAVEMAGTENLQYNKTNVSNMEMNSSNYLYNLGVNQNGPKLRDAFSNVKFRGLAGEFNLTDGQLQSFVFEIVNVVDSDLIRNVGFWSPETGLTKRRRDSIESGLRPIVWPGDWEDVGPPKGWQIPTEGKKLRVGVPVKDGFWEFVSVVRDPKTNATEVSGYCIDMFKAVIEALPYAVAYEFIPNDKSNADPGGTYNDLTHLLFLGKFDAVVGDITIRANRSEYIDYTLPFTESGVSMVVPMKSSKNTSPWAFLKPLTLRLWLLILGSFLYMALIVWILEHRFNREKFGQSGLDQSLNSLWYSFSTMVFAQGDVKLQHWTKPVVIIWFFLVLIITQSYTASLTSLLTVQVLKPAVTDINQLRNNGENIGYQGGSFVYEILKSLKFDDSQLKTYQSTEEMHDLFMKGSMNGGISAAVDENPYIKIFLAKYCSQYTTTEQPTYKADGFGFGFPRGSPLVPDISRAILKVTEGDRITEIENAWFRKVRKCSASEATELSSTRLGIESFYLLFVGSGIVSAIAVFVSIGHFLYYEWTQCWNRRISIWEKFCNLGARFINPDAELIGAALEAEPEAELLGAALEAEPEAELPGAALEAEPEVELPGAAVPDNRPRQD